MKPLISVANLTFAASLAMGLGSLSASGQADSETRSVRKGAQVEFLFPEQITVTAGKAADVALHFRVAPGLHINSHQPKDEYLIATTFSIPDGLGVKLDNANYPAGGEIRLAQDPDHIVSVYTGDFTIDTRITAAAGNHLVEAKLHYQACSDSICMPPKTIPVAIDVIGQ